MGFRLERQAAIVTGASRGLGQMAARALAEAGCALVLAARTEAPLAALAAELAGGGGRALACPCDVAEAGHAARLVGRAVEAFGRLDGVVLNAGIATVGPAEDEDMGSFARVLHVDVTAQMLLAREAARRMIAQGGGGWMILLSSILGRRAGTGPGVAAYAAAKGAIEQLTRELARQWARYDIRVNALAPGYFPTDMNAPMMADPGRHQAVLERTPMGRMGTAADLAGPLVFLASPAARFVTGQSLAVDGGMSAW